MSDKKIIKNSITPPPLRTDKPKTIPKPSENQHKPPDKSKK